MMTALVRVGVMLLLMMVPALNSGGCGKDKYGYSMAPVAWAQEPTPSPRVLAPSVGLVPPGWAQEPTPSPPVPTPPTEPERPPYIHPPAPVEPAPPPVAPGPPPPDWSQIAWKVLVAGLINSAGVLFIVQVIKAVAPWLRAAVPWVLPFMAIFPIGPVIGFFQNWLAGKLGAPIDLTPILGPVAPLLGVFAGGTAVAAYQIRAQRHKRWFTIDETARLLNVTPQRVQDFVQHGRLVAVTMQQGTLVDPASVDRMRLTGVPPAR
jgi:hypothetical protein